ncbi:hypothetical protein [Methylobacterium sp. JK268]
MRIALATVLLLAAPALPQAQTLELDQRLRSCLVEQAPEEAKSLAKEAEKPDLKHQAVRLLGRCPEDTGAWLHACRAQRSEPDCHRGADVRAVAALQGGKGGGEKAEHGSGGH